MLSRRQIERQSKTCLRDIVAVRSQPTVVRLEHLHAEDASWISSSYYLTDDVRRHLESLQTALGQPTGCGMFVVGQYGSGKSHLLAYVAQQIRGPCRPSDAAAKRGQPGRVVLDGLISDVTAISLLNHPARRRLEEVVLEALNLPVESGDRRQTWAKLNQRYPQGLLLIIDELSEFLRSKSSSAAFHEDVRFLQFLGEWAQGHRLWILAAMQEQVEHLGDLEYGMYRKIKDRFPLRLLLTPGHVVDLLSESILVKKTGYQEAVDRVVSELREAFPNLVSHDAELQAIYPIHPATLEVLEEIRDCFSQTRGVVDFVVGQLNGSLERQIEPFLDQPRDCLLTPDAIIDHFRDLFELQAEFVPLSQQLLPYYRKHLAEMFESEKLVELAGRIIKLLMLTYIAPTRSGLTVDQALDWLLYRAVRIDPGKNRAVLERVLETLVDRGRYVARKKDGRYALNLLDDGGAALDRFLEREKSELRERGAIVLESLIPLLTDHDFHPFSFPREQRQAQRVRWHFHERPYFVYVGDRDPEAKDGMTICIRLPWGEQRPVAGIHTVRPSRLPVGEEVIELAALVRAREKFWSGKAASRLESRFQERLNFFRLQLRNAYREATVSGPDAQVEPAPRIAPDDCFTDWLDKLALAALRQTYPSFERFAPVHGPLPGEAYRSLMRFVSDNDLGQFDANDEVKLIREAYLVPMNLLKRKGREYVFPKNPEQAELVRLMAPLVETETSPKLIYKQLQGPVYGLVPDQISLLLVYLLILGEIDILKGQTSYRAAFETLPNPLQYDRIIPGRALRGDQIRELTAICDGLQIRLPGQMTVMAQRRAAAALSRRLAELTEPLRGLQVRLRETPGGAKLADRLAAFLQRVEAHQSSDGELRAFQQFLFEFGTANRFLHEHARYRELGEKLDGTLESLKRYQHLLSHPVVTNWDDANLQLRAEALGTPPDLEQLDALDHWLGEARTVYATYAAAYAQRHQAWWEQLDRHRLWTWQPNRLSESRHLGLTADLEALRACRSRAQELRCSGLVNLDFQPACHCGFDGQMSPIAAQIEQFDLLEEKVQSSLAHFFAQQKVRLRVQQWVDERIEVNPPTLAYLEGEAPLPEVHNLALFDQYLAGIELVKEIDAGEWCSRFAERVWEPSELIAAVRQYLEQFPDARVRLKTQRPESTNLVSWCVEQSLRHGLVMPKGVPADELQAAADTVHPQWVSKRAVDQLERLGLGEAIENGVAKWILNGQISPPRQPTKSPFVASLVDVLRPTESETAAQLATQCQRLYLHHARILKIAPQAWLQRLDQLARHMPAAKPDKLTDVLTRNERMSWVVIDALGVALAPWWQESVGELFPSWRFEQLEYALVSPPTTTDQWYRDIVDSGVRRSLEKINALDVLLHDRFVPLDDLWRLAVAELTVACRKLVPRLPADRPLLIFADHGFRIDAHGRTYCHGGDSALERLVPVITMVPY